MLTIRLQRTGRKHESRYRIVIADRRRAVAKRSIETLGFLNRNEKPRKFELDRERVQHWLAMGAQMSPTVKSLFASTASK